MKNCMVQTCPVLLLVLFHSSWPTFKTEGKKTKQKKNYICTEKWETEVAMMNMKKNFYEIW